MPGATSTCSLLSNGLYTAMTTTVAGLIVGIRWLYHLQPFGRKNQQSSLSDGGHLSGVFRFTERTCLRMNLKGRNKITPEFNMSSMTDIVVPLVDLFYDRLNIGQKFGHH